jgi:hypothetical protein
VRQVRRYWFLHVVSISIILVVLQPFLIRQNAWAEWSNAFYFISDRHIHSPLDTNFTYFLHTYQSGFFYPQHLFYGGFATFLIVGVLHPLSSLSIFLISIFLAYLGSYIGCFLILRFFNTSRWVAIALSLSVALSPYMVTELYGRGAWAELMGFSCCLLSIGWFLKLIRTDGGTNLFESTCFVFVTAIAISIHNLSSVLAILLLLPILTIYCLINGLQKTPTTARRFRYFTFLGLAAVLTTMFFTLPNFYYGRNTDVSKWNISSTGSYFSASDILLSPFLRFPTEQEKIHRVAFGADVKVRLFNQTLIIFLVITSLAVLYLLITKQRQKVQRLIAFGLVLIPWSLVLLQIHATSIMQVIPSVAVIQFPYRLTPYLTLFIAISTSLIIQKISVIKVSQCLNFFLIGTVLWYVGLAIFQANTSVYSAPPGFAAPILSEIGDGLPSPLFAGNTAAPIQFRFTDSGKISSEKLRTLNFDEDGFPRDTQIFDIRIAPTELSTDRTHIVVQTGRSGRATSIGFINNRMGRLLVIDCWGQAPRKILLNDLEQELATFSFRLDWSLNRVLITSKSLYRDVLVNLISDELYTLRFGTNMAQSSLFDVAGAEKISVSNIKQINSHLNPGRYRTNVVYSPLTRWTGSLQSNSSNDGMWILETSIERPHVAMNWSLPVKLGLFLSIFGLLLVLVLLLYGVYRPA